MRENSEGWVTIEIDLSNDIEGFVNRIVGTLVDLEKIQHHFKNLLLRFNVIKPMHGLMKANPAPLSGIK
jgi:hypothetical protein